jgi:hypothetical protein
MARHNEALRQHPQPEGAPPRQGYNLAGVTDVNVERQELMPAGPTIGIRAGQFRMLMYGPVLYRDAVRTFAARQWLGDGDARDAPAHPVPAPGVEAKPGELAAGSDPPERLLPRLARLGGLNVLYDRPPAPPLFFATPVSLAGRRAEVLAWLEKERDLVWKRRGEVYLFRQADDWEIPREGIVSWSLLRDLRASAGAHDGYLQLEDWARLTLLSPAQRQYLAPEFPDAEHLASDERVVNGLSLSALLQLAAHMNEAERAALARPEGAGWEDWTVPTRRLVAQALGPRAGPPPRLRLLWEATPSGGRRFRFAVSRPEGGWNSGGFPQQKWRPEVEPAVSPA